MPKIESLIDSVNDFLQMHALDSVTVNFTTKGDGVPECGTSWAPAIRLA